LERTGRRKRSQSKTNSTSARFGELEFLSESLGFYRSRAAAATSPAVEGSCLDDFQSYLPPHPPYGAVLSISLNSPRVCPIGHLSVWIDQLT
jgi:hypothetical protein